MAFPPLPWRMNIPDVMIQTLQLVDIHVARKSVPDEFDIISVLPGKTIGGIYFAAYGPGSDLEYNELGAFSAYVRHSGRTGLWTAKMYVDSEQSFEMAHQCLGLPKEIATFERESGERNRISVRQGDQLLCSIEYGRRRYFLRKKARMGAFSVLNGEVIYFYNDMDMYAGLTRANISVPLSSPLAPLQLNRPFMTICATDSHAVLVDGLTSVGNVNQ